MTGCRDCARYEKQIQELREENAYLKFELETIKSKIFKRSKKKKPPKDGFMSKSEPKRKGGLFGHTGWFRKKPGRIDKVEDVHLKRCPICGCKDIRECLGVEEHLQQDIVLPRVETTLYRKHRYYCKTCGKTVAGKGNGELAKSYIGPVAKSLAVFLKYEVKVSDRDIKKIFGEIFGLKIVPSSIAGFRSQLSREGLSIYEGLLEEIKKGKFIHADETGWRIDGENQWLWKFSNKKISISHIDKSRGQKVVEKILGKEYKGVLITDFLSAYNKIETRGKQRCLVHIIRDLNNVIDYWGEEDKETVRYCKRLKRIFNQAIELSREYKDKEWDKAYYRRRRIITEQLKDFSFPNPNKKMLVRFAKRLERHKGEIFTFLYKRDVDYHNNHAEQQIRPSVILRKITYGNRSIEGAKNHDVLMSILQTAKLNRIDPIETFKGILLHLKNNPLDVILAPP